jgi:hypothetical protein
MTIPETLGMRKVLALLGWGLVTLGACGGPPPQEGGEPARGASSGAEALESSFLAHIRPFFERYCLECHGPKKKKGDLDLSGDLSVASIAGNPRRWDMVRNRLEAREMPPEETSRQPKAEERGRAVAWLHELSDREAARNAGDPGVVLARRLSNAEYDYTIRDLTGVDLRPTREFPVDPANEAGFDNSGESLSMSEALLRKYLAAARFVADHLVLKPEGFVFAPHPVVTDTDRDKYSVQRIVAFYTRHRVDLSAYFMAAWRFRNREALGKPEATLGDFAREAGVSPRYLATLWGLLLEAPAAESRVAEFSGAWAAFPSGPGDLATVRSACDRLSETVTRLRQQFPAQVEPLQAKGISRGTQPFMLWRNDELAARHLKAAGEVDRGVARFCGVFPDAWVVLERSPYYDKESSPKGRLLSAGFHLMQGYYRDDGPLYTLVLSDAERREIDTLWDELHFVTQDYLRQYKDYIFFERAEPPRSIGEAAFDFARSEDKDATSDAKIEQLREAYLAKARKNGASSAAIGAIESFYRTIQRELRQVEAARRAAEPRQLEALQAFAERAYRRPLSSSERAELLGFYRRLREREGLGHEEALRDTLSSILLSPHFGYRVDLRPGKEVAGSSRVPLTDVELASRLSYFLWSSMPDAELLAHAQAGELRRPDVLTSQVRRMLADPKIRGLATEFAGNWLDVRRFEEHNAVDRERFPSFTPELRQAMFEEPIRYVMEVAQRNRSILDFLYGRDTVVNRVLARHYGMPEPPPGSDDWVRVEDADRYGRGGLLTMAVFLTKNAPGLRTSPVKRGYWVVRRLLGEVIPPPPPTVPSLPKDEAALGEKTLPEMLARHREDPACAGCHKRFDSVGLVFEGFGPIGERREKDLGGKPVQTEGKFPDGQDRKGLSGLRAYLREKREGEFVDNLCRKLLSYALGRSLLPSDRKTLEDMKARLKADHHAFGSLVEVLVASPQFLTKRAVREER